MTVVKIKKVDNGWTMDVSGHFWLSYNESLVFTDFKKLLDHFSKVIDDKE